MRTEFLDMGVLDLLLQSSSSVFLLGALVVLLLVYLISSSSFSSQEDMKDPPGPKPLPFLGNLLQLDLDRPHRTLLDLSKKYGSVFTVYFAYQKVVVLAGYKTVKEALAKHAKEFGERDPLRIVAEFSQGHGVLWSNGDSWKDMRRFALSNLRDFGMGKKGSEERIIEECDYLIEVVQKFKGEPFDTTKPINNAVSNIICTLLYGNRFTYDDQGFTSEVARTNRIFQLAGFSAIQMYNLFPWIGKWTADKKEFHKLTVASRQYNSQLVSHLKETFNPQMPRGFVDAFLLRKQAMEKSGTKSYFHDENLLETVINLFSAGTDTTSTTLRWALFFMAKYPKIQDQAQEELSGVIGSRQVRVEDRKNLPFIDAVIHETQRLASIIPMGFPHKTSQDFTFQGHFIKKGTSVFPLLTSALHDETEWEKPHTFYPAHFLDKDGKFVKPEAFIPFSAGRRVCLGESLAKMELFIFFTTLLQHFRFTPPPGVSEDELDLTPRLGFVLNPLPHKLCAVSRM